MLNRERVYGDNDHCFAALEGQCKAESTAHQLMTLPCLAQGTLQSTLFNLSMYIELIQGPTIVKEKSRIHDWTKMFSTFKIIVEF